MLVSPHVLVFGLIAAVIGLVVARTFARWNADEANAFDIRDLFMENGRASKGALVMWGAFAATTWFFVFYTLTGRMTEGYFTAYSLAWIAPVVARMITNANGTPAAPPKTT